MRISGSRRALLTAVLSIAFIAGCSGSKVDQKNYDRIHVGMTESEVQQLLGKPSTTDTVSSAFGLNGSRESWQDGGRSITVIFVLGKVAGSQKSGF